MLCRMGKSAFGKVQDDMYYVAGLYMIGYGKGKIILKFPPLFRLNEENHEREFQNQNQMKTKTKTFLFLF